ncbi:MAG: carbohydrate ABC transporter permease [Angelakisella sp.]
MVTKAAKGHIKGTQGEVNGPAGKLKLFILEVFVVLLFLLFMVPFFIVICDSAKVSIDIIKDPIGLPSDWSQLPRNITALLNNPNMRYWPAFTSSLVITVLSLVVIAIASSMAAWVLARSKKMWSSVIFMLFVAAMVIPFQVVMLPLLSWFRVVSEFIGIPLLSSYQGIIFAYLGFGSSMTIFILHGFIKGVPLELEEAATIDGCMPAGTFFRIVLPLLQPVFITVLILNGIWIWNDFLLPSLMLGFNGAVQTLPIAVTSFVGSYVKQWDLILTSTLMAILPVIVLFLFAQKYIIKGMVDGSIK